MNLRKLDRSLLRKLGAVLNLVLVLALLLYFFFYAGLDRIYKVLGTVSLPWFILACFVSLLLYVFNSARLWFMLRRQGMIVPLSKLIGINLGVRFYAFFSPLSSVGGVLRFQRLIPADRIPEGLAAFAANRLFEILFLVSMGVFWGLTSLNHDSLNPLAFVLYLLALLIGLWLAFRFSEDAGAWAARKQEAAPSKSAAWVLGAAAKLFRSFSMYRGFSLSEVMNLLVISLLGDLVSLAGFALVALSMHLPVSLVDLGWIRALMLLASFTPVTLPGGMGVREVSAVILVTSLGIGADQAAAFSLLLYARSFFTALFSGLVELVLNVRLFIGARSTGETGS